MLMVLTSNFSETSYNEIQIRSVLTSLNIVYVESAGFCDNVSIMFCYKSVIIVQKGSMESDRNHISSEIFHHFRSESRNKHKII